jgi:hypothetical protein
MSAAMGRRNPGDVLHEDLRQILLVLGLGDHARPCSPHEVVQREVLPAIRRLMGVSVHKPFTDDGVTYCGWATGHEVIDGCGEVWPCAAVRKAQPPDEVKHA